MQGASPKGGAGADPATVEARLREAYGQPWYGNKRDPVGELVYILLSAQTREAECQRAFARLWRRFRSWDGVRRASAAEIEALIRDSGLARRKTRLIQSLLGEIRRRNRRTSLAFLSGWPDEAALAYLGELPGVGPKTARCVLMYSLGRAVLPVDTHAWRIGGRLGWVAGGRHPDPAGSRRLEDRVPPEFRHSLHVTLIAHGRQVCRASPVCDSCILWDVCPSFEPMSPNPKGGPIP